MWKFLIQQEGEEYWQVLEDEISILPEGRYRMVANSQLKQSKVEIFILHIDSNQKLQPMPKYLRKANEQGLVMIFSHKNLSAGFWQIICSTPEGEGKIDLEITPKVPMENQPSVAQLLENWKTTPQSELERLIKTEIEPYLDEHFISPSPITLDLQIVLSQNSFFCLKGEVVPLFGTITAKEGKADQFTASEFKLSYQLKSIFDSGQLHSQEQSIAIDRLPFSFQYFLEIPQDLPNTTFQGEIFLLFGTKSLTSETFNVFTENAPSLQDTEQKVVSNDISNTVDLKNNPALPPKLDNTVNPRREVILPSFLN